MNLTEQIASAIALIMLLPILIGLLTLIRQSGYRKNINPSTKQLLSFNSFVYSFLLVQTLFDFNAFSGFIILSFLMLPTYSLLLWGKWLKWKENRIVPYKPPSKVDLIKLKIRRKARDKYRARIEAKEARRKQRETKGN